VTAKLAMAIGRVNANGPVQFSYTGGEEIGIYILTDKTENPNLMKISKDAPEVYAGLNEDVAVLREDCDLGANPAAFMCTQMYREFLGEDKFYKKVAGILATYKDAAGFGLVNQVTEAKNLHFGSSTTVKRSKLDLEFSLAFMMSHERSSFKEEAKKLWNNRRARIGLVGGTAGALALIGTFMCIGYNRRKAQEEPVEVTQQQEEPVVQKPEPVVQKPEPESKKPDEEPVKKGTSWFGLKEKLAGIDVDKLKENTKKALDEMKKQAEKTAQEKKPEQKPEPEKPDYAKIAAFQLKVLGQQTSSIQYETITDSLDAVEKLETEIEKLSKMLSDNKDEIKNHSELEEQLAGIKKAFEKKNSYAQLAQKTQNPETRDQAYKDMVGFCFGEDKYDEAWKLVEQVPEEKRKELGAVYQIYMLEKAVKEGSKAERRTPKGLTEKVVAQAEENLRKGNYEVAEVLKKLKDAQIDVGNSVELVAEMPNLRAKLEKLPPESLNAILLKEEIDNKDGQLDGLYKSILGNAKKALEEEGYVGPDASVLKQLGDLYQESGKPEKAKEYHSQFEKITKK
jgi:tetratricopeptide (TPR) repeat protein